MKKGVAGDADGLSVAADDDDDDELTRTMPKTAGSHQRSLLS